MIISHNVSTHEISQVVCCASHIQNDADTSLCGGINFIHNQAMWPHESNVDLQEKKKSGRGVNAKENSIFIIKVNI